MAGMTFTTDRGYDGDGQPSEIRKVICTWTSASDVASGDVRLVGTLVKATTNPGSAAPTDNYDITLTDEDGVDVLANCQSSLANRDTTTSEEVYFLVKDAAPLAQSIHPVVCNTITVSVAAAGDAKNGVINLYLRD